MNSPRVTIGVIFYKGCEKYLSKSLTSLTAQDYPNLEFLFRDQSPNGEVYDYLQKNQSDLFNKTKITKGPNLMHSGGHNALIREMTGEYYVCASNDMLYPPDFVSKFIVELEKPENAPFGSATCKLMQWDWAKAEAGDLEASYTNVLDSCGIGIRRTHHFFDRGQGQPDHGQYDSLHSVFGASGALVIFRKKTLEDIRYRNEYFDELIHYKSDVDLAYRLQWAGQSCLFIPGIRVYHDRQASGRKGMIESRRERSGWTKEDSFLGHLVVLEKNFDKNFSWRTRISTWLYNAVKFFYILLLEPSLLKQYSRMRTHAAEIELKKNAMKKTVTPQIIESFMT